MKLFNFFKLFLCHSREGGNPAKLGFFTTIFIMLLFSFSISYSAEKNISQIIISGNQRIEKEVILKSIKSKVGSPYDEFVVEEDINNLFNLGLFSSIKIEKEEENEGLILNFILVEKPAIRKILIEGNTVYEKEEILKDLTVKLGIIPKISLLRENIEIIRNLYIKKNYFNCVVSYEFENLEKNEVKLIFKIKEGDKAYVRDIVFEGNVAFKKKELKKKMKTETKGFFSWLSGSGTLDKNILTVDVSQILTFYKDNGYMDVKIAEPVVEIIEYGKKKDKKKIKITIKIEEGKKYNFGKIDIAGDLIDEKDNLLKGLESAKPGNYNQTMLQNDISKLSTIYADKGYANVDVYPLVDKNEENNTANITYQIEKGGLVYFEKIIVAGNTKTRDKVIRRELRVYEQELYSGSGINRSIRNLHRLDFFKDVKVKVLPGGSNEMKVLSVEVEDKPTGLFTIGGGYSTLNDFFFQSSLGQRNLFGRGQSLDFSTQLGEIYDSYSINFTEPYLFDIPLAAGFSLYNLIREYTDYDKDSWGGSVFLGYRFWENTMTYLTYAYDLADIKNITREAGDPIYNYEGENVTSSVTLSFRYDTRDKIFNPREGANHRISLQTAGGDTLGGNIKYNKVLGELGYYHPLFFKKLVGFVHSEGGALYERNNFPLDYERFHLGGMYSLRGFKDRSITIIQDDKYIIGGNKYILFNTELLYTLSQEANIVGVVFFDAGDVYNNNESVFCRKLNESAGYGFRWYSPVGPFRLEYGKILRSNDPSLYGGRWEFTMGLMF